MAVVLGLLVALTYGSGDFFGGIAATKSRATAVVIGSFSVSAVLLVVVSAGWWAIGGLPTAQAADIRVGVATGCLAPVALSLLYRGLALGRMSVVAPITAVVAAVVPFGWGLFQGERPSTVALVGVAVALVAVALISGAPTHPDDDTTDGATPPSLVATALASGFGFGLIFILLGAATDEAGLWPLLSARLVAVALTVSVLVVWNRARARSLRPALIARRPSWGPVAAAGVLDITANVLYLSAVSRGLLSIVAVLSSLYPASTVVLARVFLGERLHRVQVVGLMLAAAGVIAMAAA